MRTWHMIAAAVGTALVILLGISLIINWEVSHTKKEITEKAKQVLATPERVDSTAKIAGRVLFGVKNFKNKVKAEINRLDDSTKAAQ